ncbi:hypothetical protein [Streptomyces sp. NBC_00102]|uniref:hypothetical protein n=1 Tax=Streptomyces sp. NBC_00102 TaxID=2975652 RepID=UPI002251804E|nr:hypothetical protein [Streptomyces sp. NBC_00102]MCX5401600.1 hypothetical protein [Streptomyces sp. NBC_00102]
MKYDLGGTITDTRRLMEVVEARHGALTVDMTLLRSWNLSYLAGHAPVVSCALPGGEARLAGGTWSFACRMRVYPWLGVVSVDYAFTLIEGTADIETFYDDLVEWKNRDYLPYLERCDALSDNLGLRIPAGLRSGDLETHGSAVRALRVAAADIIEPRPFCYAFHDFRLCFVGDLGDLPGERVRQLLWLSDDTAALPEDGIADSLGFRGLEITSSGWSTVIRGEAGAVAAEAETVVSLLNLVHAQWYVCQLWINAHDLRGRPAGASRGLAGAHVLSENQTALVQDLSEIDNLDVMLKDPVLLRVAEYLETNLKVRRHKETAMSRLHALENHSRQLADYNNETELRRVQVLFAISAAAGIASLVPSLTDVGFTLLHVVATIIPLLGFWALFAVDFTRVRRRPRTRRRRP